MSNPDWYLEPPDEPEAVICEECGQEEVSIHDWDGAESFRCRNPFCPAKFIDPAIKEMAEKLVEALDTVSRLEGDVLRLRMTLRINNQDLS